MAASIGRRSWSLGIHEAAARSERAGGMVRALCVADLAAVLDEVHVGLVPLIRREQTEDQVVGVFHGGLRRQRPDTAQDAVDVPVDR
jgi:hypothetical protein